MVELRALPARSTTATRLLLTLQDPRSGPAEVAAVLETDPALAVRVLHLANTPFYGLARRVGSVQHAVTVLGFTTVRAIAAATAVGMIGDEAREDADDLWRHSLAAASAATVIARHTAIGGTDVFGAALLHDVGTALLRRIAPAELDAAIALAEADDLPMVEAERRVLGMCHAEAGGRALEELGLPDKLVQAVRRHHDPAPNSAAAVIAAADEAAYWLAAGSPTDGDAVMLEAFALAGVPEDRRSTAVEEIQAKVDDPGLLVALGR